MRKISLWASYHRWSARFFIIFLIYPLLNFTGWLFGEMLYLNGIEINYGWYYLLSLITILVAATYPQRSERTSTGFYTKRKIHDTSLALLSFLFITLTGNHFNAVNQTSVAPVHASTQLTAAPSIEKPVKKEKKNLKKFIKDVRKKYKSAGDGEKILLISLTIILALVLIYLLGALSCSIACGGAEGLAYVVFFLGLGGIIFGTVRVIRGITRKSKKKEQETKASE